MLQSPMWCVALSILLQAELNWSNYTNTPSNTYFFLLTLERVLFVLPGVAL